MEHSGKKCFTVFKLKNYDTLTLCFIVQPLCSTVIFTDTGIFRTKLNTLFRSKQSYFELFTCNPFGVGGCGWGSLIRKLRKLAYGYSHETPSG